MFGKKRKKDQEQQKLHRVGERVANAVVWVQLKWTKTLNGRTQHWSKRQQLIFLIAFLLVFSGFNIGSYFLSRTGSSAPVVNAGQLATPVRVSSAEIEPTLTREDSASIRNFRQLVDSLRRTPEGTVELNRFLNENPGLFESFLRIEKQIGYGSLDSAIINH